MPFAESFDSGGSQKSLAAAVAVLPHLWKITHFSSVVDVGCGGGAWLFAARQFGAHRVLGFDINTSGQLLVHPSDVIVTDLNNRIPATERYDLCLCIDVAEYLHPGRSISFVEDLTRLSDVVAFASAIPFQNGERPLNGSWPERWASFFAANEFLPWLGVRNAIWNVLNIPWTHRQNLIVYIKESEWERYVGDAEPASGSRLTMIHPEHYLAILRQYEEIDAAARSRAVGKYYRLTR